MRRPALTRRWIGRGVVLILVLALLTPTAVSAVTYDGGTSTEIQRGTIAEPARGVTVAAVQGFHFRGQGATKKPARLIAYGPRGNVRWIHNGEQAGATWFYDVDPLENGHLLVVATVPAEHGTGTLIYEFAPGNQSIVWTERFPFNDTHDADLINGDQLLIAHMRNYDNATDQNNDRLLIYDRSADTVVWEWLFRNHYDRAAHRDTSFGRGGTWTHDWTHVNDVDKVGPGEYLASPRNFDQVILVNRSTGDIDLRLGEDNDHSILHEQHNPQYLESENGTPTVLVADSENDRIVEYAKREDGWERTWELGGPQSFNWPRDADRLPNGNTLVVDSLNHRVIEVTPTGRIVWEVTAPWGTYDVERIPYGNEPGGPTIADQNATGDYAVSGSAGLVPGTGGRTTFAGALVTLAAGTPLQEPVQWFAARWSHTTPWIYPAWMSGWDFVTLIAAGLLVVGWALAELTLERRRIVRVLRRHVP